MVVHVVLRPIFGRRTEIGIVFLIKDVGRVQLTVTGEAEILTSRLVCLK